MDTWAKKTYIDKWDNTGFQIGNEDRDITKILISLDVDEEVVNKAIKEDFQMIISHHPIIFKPLKEITSKSFLGQLLSKIIKNDLVIYNAHTNLDIANSGVNDQLAQILGLEGVQVLVATQVEDGKSLGYGRYGYIKPVGVEIFINEIKSKLDVKDLRVYGFKDTDISKIAVCGGSGSEFITDAYKIGADIYITGDIKYHEAQLANQLGIMLVDAGHYHTEKIVLPKIKEYLLQMEYSNLYFEVFYNNSAEYKLF